MDYINIIQIEYDMSHSVLGPYFDALADPILITDILTPISGYTLHGPTSKKCDHF